MERGDRCKSCFGGGFFGVGDGDSIGRREKG